MTISQTGYTVSTLSVDQFFLALHFPVLPVLGSTPLSLVESRSPQIYRGFQFQEASLLSSNPCFRICSCRTPSAGRGGNVFGVLSQGPGPNPWNPGWDVCKCRQKSFSKVSNPEADIAPCTTPSTFKKGNANLCPNRTGMDFTCSVSLKA